MTMPDFICPYSHIQLSHPCGPVECARCGWNPAVNQRRRKALSRLNGVQLREWGREENAHGLEARSGG